MLLALTGSLAAPAQCASADDLLARMAALNPNLHAFTATMHADVAMKSFPFLSFALVGTYYHKEPDKNKVVFTGGVPAVAQQFDKLYAHIESPSQWRELVQGHGRLRRRQHHGLQARASQARQRRSHRCHGRRPHRDGPLDALELPERRLCRDDQPVRTRGRQRPGRVADRRRARAGLFGRDHLDDRRLQNQSGAAGRCFYSDR